MVRQMASSARVPLGIALSFVLALSTLPVQALAEATDAPQAELEAEALEVVDNEALAEEDELSAEDATEKAEEPELTAETQPDESPETDVEDEAALIGEDAPADDAAQANDAELVDEPVIEVATPAEAVEEPGGIELEAQDSEIEGTIGLLPSGPTGTLSKKTQTITASNKTVDMASTVSLGAKASAGGKLTYKSTNTKVATVNAKGVVTGLKGGTVKITITAAATSTHSQATKTVTVTVRAGSWQKDSGGWWWRRANGSYPKSCFLTIEGVRYYFDANGYVATGWKKVSGAWYHFSGSGAMQTGWQQIDGQWYWFASNGKMATGLRTINKSIYYFGTSGAMRTGWQQVGSKWYHFRNSGAADTSTWVGDYYVNAKGVMLTNTVTPDGWQVDKNGLARGKYTPNSTKESTLYVTKVTMSDFVVTVPKSWVGSWSMYKNTRYDNAWHFSHIVKNYGGGGCSVVVTDTYTKPGNSYTYATYVGMSSRGKYVWLADMAGGKVFDDVNTSYAQITLR